ncbi:Mu transposase domain-containing protein [Streptomyces sp. NPDC050548]|uniref:Mu transposase domain-containing protein n=1 Tax=Streptomyces sp. NPDC050548 TaxID=3365629 RepID=UPI0037A75FE7
MKERSCEVPTDLYPELAVPGGLGEALTHEAARHGHAVGPMEPVEGFAPAVAACRIRGMARFAVYATNDDEREFRMQISADSGSPWVAFGSTDSLAVVTAVLHEWCEGASTAQLRREWTLLTDDPLTAAPQRRTYRPWIPEPGRWLQFDWGEGPRIGGRRTWLFCAWLSWSRFRVVIPVWDCTLGTLVACLDTTLRRIGGAPTYVLTDNAKTVTVEHIAGIPVRHPQMVAAGRHYGCQVVSCVPYDPESKGGAEATVRIAKADLVPTDANLLAAYDSFAELADACRTWCEQVNSRRHRATGQIPADRLDVERTTLHVLPLEPLALALGEERLVGSDRTISFNSVRYSTPPGYTGARVWCRVVGEELSITARTNSGDLSEIWRHQLSTPGVPQIIDAHYPGHPDGRSIHQPRLRPRSEAEIAFVGIGPGAGRWLKEAGPAGAVRIRAKMARAVELATVLGNDKVDQPLDWPPRPGGSPTTTCSRSWDTSRTASPPARSSARTRPTRSRTEPSAGRPWAAESTSRPPPHSDCTSAKRTAPP